MNSLNDSLYYFFSLIYIRCLLALKVNLINRFIKYVDYRSNEMAVLRPKTNNQRAAFTKVIKIYKIHTEYYY